MLERRVAADELLVDRARAVGVLPAEEAGVHDGVPQTLAAARRVHGLAQAALVVPPALVLVQVSRTTITAASSSGITPSANGLWPTTISSGSRSRNCGDTATGAGSASSATA